MPVVKSTGYGWLIRMPDGTLQEFATDAEAIEAWQDAIITNG